MILSMRCFVLIIMRVNVAAKTGLGKKFLWLLALLSLLLHGVASPAVSRAQAGDDRAHAAVAAMLRVSAGTTCLREDVLVERVAEWLAGSPIDASLRIDVIGDPSNARVVSFSLRRGASVVAQRRFDPTPSLCGQKHAVVALSIAMAVRSSLLEGLQISSEHAEATPKPAWIADFSGLVIHGLGPSLGFGVDIGFSLRVAGWFEVRAAVWAGHSAGGSFEGIPGRYDLTLAALSLGSCFVGEGAQRLALRVCTGPTAGPLFARGRDFARSETSTTLWTAWFGRVDVQLRVRDSLWASLGFGAAFALRELDVLVRASDGSVVQRGQLDSPSLSALLGLAYRL